MSGNLEITTGSIDSGPTTASTTPTSGDHDCPYWIKGYCVADRSCKLRHDLNKGGQLQESYLAQTRNQIMYPAQPRLMVPAPAGYGYPVGGAQIASAVYGGHVPIGYGYGYYGGHPQMAGGPAGHMMHSAPTNGPPRNYKTVACRHHMRGQCLRGNACGFRHGEEEPSEGQSATYGHLPAELSNPIHPGRPFRTTTCKRWLQGNCTMGDRCTFRHDYQGMDGGVNHYSGMKRTLSPDRDNVSMAEKADNSPPTDRDDAVKLQKVQNI